MEVRAYQNTDYAAVRALYENEAAFGGVIDDERDSEKRLYDRITEDPQAILVAIKDESVVGTISLIEDKRVAWLYRFATVDSEAARILYAKASEILKQRGHHEVIVYSDPSNDDLTRRYVELGFKKGKQYQAFWNSL